MPTPDAAALAAAIEATLRAAGTPERAAQEKRYLRSSLEHLGATVPAIRKAAAAALRATQALDHDGLVAVVELLWARGVFECRRAAVELLEMNAGRLVAADVQLLERLLRDARTWALVDTLAARVAGPLLMRVRGAGGIIDRWARDADFWLRRSALLLHLMPLREGRGSFERFARHADAMLEDTEFFVRKAIGWVLRDASRRDPDRVAAWLLPRAARASGVTLREAVKHLPARRRSAILAAAGGRRSRPAGRVQRERPLRDGFRTPDRRCGAPAPAAPRPLRRGRW